MSAIAKGNVLGLQYVVCTLVYLLSWIFLHHSYPLPYARTLIFHPVILHLPNTNITLPISTAQPPNICAPRYPPP